MTTKPSAQPRPGRPKSSRKRRAILEAAACQFLQAGYRQTAMDAIAAQAGVSKQTVYSHFASKEDLFSACVTGKVQDYGLDMDSLSQDMPLAAALTLVGRQFIDLVSDPQVIAMHRLLVAEATEHPELARLFHDSGPAFTMASLARFLAGHAQRSNAAPDDCQQQAEVFFTLLKHTYFLTLLMNLGPPMTAAERRLHVARSSAFSPSIRRSLCGPRARRGTHAGSNAQGTGAGPVRAQQAPKKKPCALRARPD